MQQLDSFPAECGDIILIRSNTWINWIVRLATQSGWGHSVMYIGNDLYVQSDIGGVNVRHIGSILDKEIRILRHKKMTKSDAGLICRTVLRDLGKGYDYKAIFDLIKIFITGRKATNKEIGNKKKFICSELIAKAYYEFGYTIIPMYSYDEIVPYDFDDSRNFTRIY